jgi:hypothetical protein
MPDDVTKTTANQWNPDDIVIPALLRYARVCYGVAMRRPLTERGRAAATTQAAARQRIDTELIASVGEGDVRRMRRTLAALIDLGSCQEQEQDAA